MSNKLIYCSLIIWTYSFQASSSFSEQLKLFAKLEIEKSIQELLCIFYTADNYQTKTSQL